MTLRRITPLTYMISYEYCVAPYPPLALSSVTALPTSGTNGSTFTITSLPLNQPTSTTQYVYPSSHLPAPTNVAPGTITYGCDYYWPVQANDTCTSLESTFGIAASDFTFWNANPTTKCPSLVSGTSVCIMVNNATDALPPRPSNAATGSAPNGCAKWYTVSSAVAHTICFMSLINRTDHIRGQLWDCCDRIWSDKCPVPGTESRAERAVHEPGAEAGLLCDGTAIYDHDDHDQHEPHQHADWTAEQPRLGLVHELHFVPHYRVRRHLQLDGDVGKHLRNGSASLEPGSECRELHKHSVRRSVLCRRWR
jgi:hypothetical protein